MTASSPTSGWRQVGDVGLIVLSDGLLRSSVDFMAGAMPAEVSAMFLQPDSEGDIWIGLNCVLVRSAERTILVDTGFGDGPLGDDPDLLREGAGLTRALRREGVDPAAVDVVVNTHLHADHAGGNLAWSAAAPAPAFVNADYIVQQAEYDFALSGVAPHGLYAPEEVRFLASTNQLRTHDHDLQLAPGVSVRKAPGHTPGHQIVVVESRGETVAVTGDLAPMQLHLKHPEWELRGDHEPAQAVMSRRALVEWAKRRSAAVVAYHEPDHSWARMSDGS
jgi:glyoxylase-like metal-dependent hydrolase (beta-lactamase superfamily II)